MRAYSWVGGVGRPLIVGAHFEEFLRPGRAMRVRYIADTVIFAGRVWESAPYKHNPRFS